MSGDCQRNHTPVKLHIRVQFGKVLNEFVLILIFGNHEAHRTIATVFNAPNMNSVA